MITGRKNSLKAHMGAGEAPPVRLPEGERTVSFHINDERLEVPKGTTILEAALNHGIEIPYFCFHPGLSPEGNCRMCLVELVGRPKLEPSCTIPAADGMMVYTDSPAVHEARKGVLEFLLLNHPLDCPWCDKAGECMLQDSSYAHGSGEARHQLEKRTYPVKDFGPKLKMYMSRCIHCTRCVRFLKEVEGKEEFSLYRRGAQVDVGTYIEHNLSGNYQGCLADICPVGALVTKPFLYRARVFDLEAQASICPMCSAGCSIYVDRVRNRVARLRPRPNLEVNDWWMCDSGRFGWEWIERDRLTVPLKNVRDASPSAGAGTAHSGSARGEACDWQEALALAQTAAAGAGAGFRSIGGIVAATASCEEVYLLQRLVRGLGGSVAAWYGPEGRIDPGAMNDFLHRKDPNPNTLGLEAVLGEIEDLEGLLSRAERGHLETVIILQASLDEAAASRLMGAEEVIVISSHYSPAVAAATLALPGAVWLEKHGTFVNGAGHLQRFLKALEIETEARPDVAILSELLRRCGISEGFEGPEQVFAEMARATMPFFGLAYDTIPPGGVRLSQPIRERA